ncbi:oxidoreductase [Leptolyngbya sp. NIES-2104]|uniref:oxidoreductase n=1 Tax=Leptolyngbya sp. NIES-2104 TaxID=1552121 RepID=UPI0006EC7A39|nr:oxidoreductase [Leptolyngbya sp. NIES-2104]GAP96826.1 3-oxoacyl-[acyl-carrier protein] reductase [Leptolyngbya sp. NIES-2104]
MSNSDTKVWLITGSSSGFGRSLVEAVLKKGDRVVATARKPEQLDDLVQQYPETIHPVRLDVTNPQEIQASIKSALNQYACIDVLVNNAGYATLGAIEEFSDEDIRRQFETNFFGVLNMTRAVLPTMRKQRSGHILNISSFAGVVAFGGLGIYSATKFAIEGISEALVQEVKPLGINVTLIEPGTFQTNGAASVITPKQPIAEYAATIDSMQAAIVSQPGDPAKAAVAMIQVVESDNPPLRLALGEDSANGIAQKLDAMKAELEAWKSVSLSTAFEGETVGARN